MFGVEVNSRRDRDLARGIARAEVLQPRSSVSFQELSRDRQSTYSYLISDLRIIVLAKIRFS